MARTTATSRVDLLDRQLGGGANQSGGRAYNERLVLSLIRRVGALPKAELARLTGLSPQTVTLIVNRFESDGMLVRRSSQRGRVGQPAVPYALNAEAAFSIGVKIGRRSVELALVDFVGKIRRRARRNYPYPTPDAVIAFAASEIRRLRRSLSPAARKLITGVGVAMPSHIWQWCDVMDAPEHALVAWRHIDIQAAIEEAVNLPVIVSNDATAACGAELFRGDSAQGIDFAYLFVGWFIGGGLVLDGSLYPGRSANAGALGSMPVTTADGSTQLLRVASLHRLEQILCERGLDPAPILDVDGDWSALSAPLESWMAEAAPCVAQAIAGVLCVLDMPSVVIDAAMPPGVRDRLVAETCFAFARMDRQGLSPVQITPGRVGPDARLLGASLLPILANFARSSDVLFKASARH